MKIRYFGVLLLVSLSLSCNAINRAFERFQPTATPTATSTPTATFTPTLTPTATATPLEAGLYIPPACEGTPVATMPAPSIDAKPTTFLSTNPKISKSKQIQVFSALTKKIKDVYLYPDFNGLDWPATVAKYRAKIDAGLDTETFYTEMGNLMDELNDEHSSFLSPVVMAAADEELNGKVDYVGIGILIQPMPAKNKVTLLSVLPGSSAERGGLKEHDSILAVDGVPIIQNESDTSLRIRGPECSAVRLRVQSPGEEPREAMFMRFRITNTLPIVARLVQTTDGSRIGYIFLPSFFDETIPGQVRKALKNFGKLDGLILDNRMNGGGSSSVVYPIFSYFTSGTVGYFSSRNSKRSLDVAPDEVANSQQVPLVVLVGKGSVSFGEIFSGALQDLGRAKIVGQTTLGNVETLNGYNFDDGSQAWIAAQRFIPLNHPKANWEETGIIPDVEAYADWDTFTFETDPAIIAALKLFGHQ